jgi:hypothetical protein
MLSSHSASTAEIDQGAVAKPAQLIATLAVVALLAAVSSGVSPRTAAAAANVYRDEALGIEFEYPGSWIQGAAPSPYVSCFDCTVFGPAEAPHPYGVELFTQHLAEGCGPTCYVGNRALPIGPEQSLTLAGREVMQLEIERQAPLGLVNETGDDTPYREIWTLIPLGDQALFLLAFYRDGDTAAEEETLSAYEGLLESLRFIAQGALPDTGTGPPAHNGSPGKMAAVLVAALAAAAGLALLSAGAINRRQAKR